MARIDTPKKPSPKAAQADLLGDAASLDHPAAKPSLADRAALEPGPEAPLSSPAEDENQAGFIGKRNLPHP